MKAVGNLTVKGDRLRDDCNKNWELAESSGKLRAGANRRSVWTIATRPYPEAHFATFPDEIPRLCILAGSRPGDTVLDPFGGSGTTNAVALRLGRDSIYIDASAAYLDLAISRVEKERRKLLGKQLKLDL